MEFIDSLTPYWSWLAVAAVLGVIGEVVKRRILRPELVATSRVALWWRRTLPLHPVATGAAIGMLGLPVPEFVVGQAAECLFFAFAGVCSVFGYDVVRTWAKHRGYELGAPL